MKGRQRKRSHSSTDRPKASGLPLSALLSQVLVAFTIEFDNEFERRMANSGFPGARLSLVVWSNLMRFLVDGGVLVRELTRKALASQERMKHSLGCLERWGFVELEPSAASDRPTVKRTKRQPRARRDGWGSGRGIRADGIVRLTRAGQKAAEIWAPLFDAIEERWETRFGKEKLDGLRETLRPVVDKLDLEVPYGLPGAWPAAESFPPRVTRDTATLFLPTLLSQLLLAFTIEFDRESNAPLELCANVLRVLGKKPLFLGELPRLTGGSPERTDIGWQLRPYVAVEVDPAANQGKRVGLTPRGLAAQKSYHRLTAEIEKRWERRFGKKEIQSLRQLLQGLFDPRPEDRSLLSEGLVAPPGVARAGASVPALGRRDLGPAARKRMRDLVVQTQTFICDPAGTLPHYPLWDMNRGFGP
jgi:DNA-binding MarR family transcriptional regulator